MPAVQSQKLAIYVRFFCVLSVFLLGFQSSARSELLPVKTYTTADGLLRDTALCIMQDSRGFLWFCSADGLSRFDGYGFTNYTTDDGLPHRVVNSFLEARGETYWVATNDGLARFNPKGQRIHPNDSAGPMFINYKVPSDGTTSIESIVEDRHGKLWCGTNRGLYWFEERDGKGAFHHVQLLKGTKEVRVNALVGDRHGNLWIGTDGFGLFRLLPDGKVENYTVANGLPVAYITSCQLIATATYGLECLPAEERAN